MDTFRLETIDNTISATQADVSFAITCSNPDNSTLFKYIEVDVQSLTECIEWSRVRVAVTGVPASGKIGPGGDLPAGVIRFTLAAQTSCKACKNRLVFTLSNLQKKEGRELPASAPIRFSLKSAANKVIGNYPDDYVFNTIRVAVAKPLIKSFRINPSITRESTDITITYETLKATACELKDASGQTVHTHNYIDPSKPFRFSGKVHLGSEGSFPQPPFYLHARLGVLEAVDNTVAAVIVPGTADWKVMDNFNGHTLLDLVLNEADDQLWAIMQPKVAVTGEKEEEPVLFCSPDGVNWMPHTCSVKDEQTGTISSLPLAIPPELVHCPCVHFGEAQLCFVGGSKVDVGICKNTITVVNLRNGARSQIEAPAAFRPRSLHGCVVFPDAQGSPNIWVIGGADKNGNGLNDVWRFDGKQWIQVPAGQSVFPKRCQFAATVQTDINGKQSIWIGGGAVRYNGSTLNDLWMYGDGGWVQVMNRDGSDYLAYSEEWLSAVSLCYVRTTKNTAKDPTNTYRYLLSNDISGNEKLLKCGWALAVDEESGYYRWNPVAGINKPELPPVFDNVRSFTLATIGFNGCAWTLAIAYIATENIAVSGLYYSCPVP